MDDIYSNSGFILRHKTPNSIKSWIFILKLTTIIFLVFMFIPFAIYEDYIGYVVVENDNAYIVFYEDVKLNKNLYIGDKKYKFEIIDDSEFTKIKIDLDENLKIDSLYLNVYIKSGKKVLFNTLIDKIKKGCGL